MNAWSSQLHVSLHHNHTASERAQGAATYYFANGSYFSEAGKRLAGYIVEALVDGLGRVDLSTHGRNFACLREIDGLAVMVEPAFLTHAVEGPALRRADAVRAEAEAIFRASGVVSEAALTLLRLAPEPCCVVQCGPRR